MTSIRVWCALVPGLLWGCGGEIVAPPRDPAAAVAADASTRPTIEATPNFLRPAPGAPKIANPVVRFYAKKGVDRAAFMYYRRAPGRTDSTVFVRFRVRDRSLARRPNGRPIAFGDSVLITIRLIDPARLILDFQPAGLQFSTDRPADLKLNFFETDKDVNDDGVVNQRDRALTQQFKIWRREGAGSPWMSLASTVTLETHEVEADIRGFTSYAIAYRR